MMDSIKKYLTLLSLSMLTTIVVESSDVVDRCSITLGRFLVSKKGLEKLVSEKKWNLRSMQENEVRTVNYHLPYFMDTERLAMSSDHLAEHPRQEKAATLEASLRKALNFFPFGRPEDVDRRKRLLHTLDEESSNISQDQFLTAIRDLNYFAVELRTDKQIERSARCASEQMNIFACYYGDVQTLPKRFNVEALLPNAPLERINQYIDHAIDVQKLDFIADHLSRKRPLSPVQKRGLAFLIGVYNILSFLEKQAVEVLFDILPDPLNDLSFLKEVVLIKSLGIDDVNHNYFMLNQYVARKMYSLGFIENYFDIFPVRLNHYFDRSLILMSAIVSIGTDKQKKLALTIMDVMAKEAREVRRKRNENFYKGVDAVGYSTFATLLRKRLKKNLFTKAFLQEMKDAKLQHIANDLLSVKKSVSLKK